MGGVTVYVNQGNPSVNAGQSAKQSQNGISGQPNTGAGGGGAAHFSGAYNAFNGGNGGSGIVTLSWMGA